MEKRELTCISCPMGCQMTVYMDNGDIKVTGNTCKRGEIYAKKEVTDPRRVVTSSVRVKNGELMRVSVKTETDIPKERIFDCMADIFKAEAIAPVKIGDIIIENCAGTGIAVIATRNVGKRQNCSF